MLTRRIIPCLDIRDGRAVKGIRFANLRDAGDPVELAERYEAQGADEIVVLDVSATSEARAAAAATVASIREVLAIPLTVGGGIRSVADAERLLCAGADKVALNTAASARPEIITEIADRTGSQCVVLALDAAHRTQDEGWELVTHSGSQRTGKDAIEWAVECQQRGVGEILLTSWDRDGTGEGYDIPLITAITARVHVPIIASGGASTVKDMAQALDAGADAVLAASIFHDAVKTIREVKQELASLGEVVRL